MAMTYHLANEVLGDKIQGKDVYIWLHTGDPGANGVANVAQLGGGNIVRKIMAFASAPSGESNAIDEQVIENTGASTWSGAEISAAQDIKFFSVWPHISQTPDDAFPMFMAEVADEKTTGSDGVTIGIGDLEIAIEVHVAES